MSASATQGGHKLIISNNKNINLLVIQ